MHQDVGLLKMDPLYRLIHLGLVVVLVRKGAKTFKKRASGEDDYEGLIALLGITLLIGFSALFRIALEFHQWSESIRILGISFEFYWSVIDGVVLDSFIYGTAASLFGCLVLWVAFKAASIRNSVWTERLIRFRYGLIGAVLLGVVCWSVVVFLYLPHRNRSSMLTLIETSVGIDAYRDPQEIFVYQMTPEDYFPPPPPPEDGEAEDTAASKAIKVRQHTIEEGIVADHRVVRKCLDRINVYKAQQHREFVRSYYLIRFCNRKSVVDLWISLYSEGIEIYVSEDASKIDEILDFSIPYEEGMVGTNKWGFRYSTSNGDWLDEVERLFL